jgi:hypothetical protein
MLLKSRYIVDLVCGVSLIFNANMVLSQCNRCRHDNNIFADADLQINMCLPTCTENEVGSQLLRLITMSTIIRAASELGYGFFYLWTSRGV